MSLVREGRLMVLINSVIEEKSRYRDWPSVTGEQLLLPRHPAFPNTFAGFQNISFLVSSSCSYLYPFLLPSVNTSEFYPTTVIL